MNFLSDLFQAIWAGTLFFIPHFTTDEAACMATPEGIKPVLSMELLEEGEQYDYVVKFRTIVFMFWAWPYSAVGKPIPWSEYRP